MDIIYGKIIMEYNEYIFHNKNLFHIVKKNDETIFEEYEEDYFAFKEDKKQKTNILCIVMLIP